MRPNGETAALPRMALALTNDGEGADCAPMEPDEPPDDDGEVWGVRPECPVVSENEEKARGVATAAYFKRYRQMRSFGLKWAHGGVRMAHRSTRGL